MEDIGGQDHIDTGMINDDPQTIEMFTSDQMIQND
jgi:hypothetical protein